MSQGVQSGYNRIAAKTYLTPAIPLRRDSHLHTRLTQRLARRFKLTTQILRVGTIDLPFTRIANPEQVLDNVVNTEARRQRDGLPPDINVQIPYWAELWDSAGGIGEFLIAHPAWVRGKDLLDLGCGMGLSGAIAAHLGARVMLADIETAPLIFAQLNSLAYAPCVRTRRLNWQTDRLSERFDVILGADILYERGQWEHLDRFWRLHLQQDGFLLLGEPGRASGDDFPDWINARGWELERFEQPVASWPKPIRVFRIKLA